ncbi:hypothetical protein TEHD23766T_1482 [Tetragenococcus halophilus subsp. flandriensis]|nr:hypothetical protein TEHD23766T_1482 [Tetragenococcus halophilus subsp. flandriensis]
MVALLNHWQFVRVPTEVNVIFSLLESSLLEKKEEWIYDVNRYGNHVDAFPGINLCSISSWNICDYPFSCKTRN